MQPDTSGAIKNPYEIEQKAPEDEVIPDMQNPY